MEYKLLRNKKGVIYTRQAEVLSKELTLIFSGLSKESNSEIVLKNSNRNELYRTLINGECKVPLDFLETGEITVRVVSQINENADILYVCEPFNVQKLNNGQLFISPSDSDLPQRIIEQELLIGNILDELALYKERLSTMEDKMSKLLEGYDID